MPTKPTIIELDMDKLEEILRRVEAKELHADDYETIRTVIESYVGLSTRWATRTPRSARLRKMLFGAKTEKTAAVVGEQEGFAYLRRRQDAAAPAAAATERPTERTVRGTPAKNHGRNGADAYTAPRRSRCLTSRCSRAIPARSAKRARSTRRTGRACWCGWWASRPWRPGSTIFRSCAAISAAWCSRPSRPRARCGEKYDATVGSMIALLKYGSGMPFNRAEKLQGSLGIPLPASTQWDIVEAKAERIEPAFEELIRQAAQGDVVHNDDTTVKILEMMGERAAASGLGRGCVAKIPQRIGRRRGSRRACSPRASSPRGKGTRSPCSSADASTPGRT